MYVTDIDSESVPVVKAPARLQTKRPTVSELLRRLDSQGITETQYRALSIVKCDAHTCIVDLSEREDF